MRLLTRSGFGGLVCGALLREVGVVDNYKFVHPKDIQDRRVDVTGQDVIAGLPYAPGCKMWFDRRTEDYSGSSDVCEGENRLAPSTARVIYDYYSGKADLSHFEEMMHFVDKWDSGNLTKDEILNPTGWIMLAFVMDPRTGLGRFHNFRISNYELMEVLMESCRTMSIDEILVMPDLRERVSLYTEQAGMFKRMLEKHSYTEGNVVVTDLRHADVIFVGNRFVIYTMFKKQTFSIWIINSKDEKNCSIAVGHNILNRKSDIHIGELLLAYGGGGRRYTGTCQVSTSEADSVIASLIKKMKTV